MLVGQLFAFLLQLSLGRVVVGHEPAVGAVDALDVAHTRPDHLVQPARVVRDGRLGAHQHLGVARRSHVAAVAVGQRVDLGLDLAVDVAELAG